MNAAFVILGALAVAVGGYRWYAGYIDRNVVEADPICVTPARMYMDGVDFMPTSKNVLFGYQFKSIAGASPVVGAIIALQWGWLPALLWLLGGVLFIGWLHDYLAGMASLRSDGLSLGGLSYKLISPRARLILLSFIYFYLLLIAGAFGAIIAGALIKLPSGPVAILILAGAGALAGHMIYRWRVNILVITGVCVGLALVGIKLGDMLPAPMLSGLPGPEQAPVGHLRHRLLLHQRRPAHLALRPAPQLRGLLHRHAGAGGRHRRHLRGHSPPSRPRPTPSLPSGWGRSGPCSSSPSPAARFPAGTPWCAPAAPAASWRARRDAKPVLAGSMFVEMVLGVVALMTAAAAMPVHPVSRSS